MDALEDDAWDENSEFGVEVGGDFGYHAVTVYKPGNRGAGLPALTKRYRRTRGRWERWQD